MELGRLLRGSHLPSLDGVRMLAVLLVIYDHAGGGMLGDLGVNAFFVLSGFLITWLLLDERERTGDVSLKRFYLRRAFRLLPAYYVFLAFAMLSNFKHSGRTDIVLPSLFYYANYFNATHGHPDTVISHTWSLAVEEQFYLLWPLLFLVLSRHSRRTAMRSLAAIIVAVGAWRSYLFLVAGVDSAWVYDAFDCRCDSLAVGCLLALACQRDDFLALAARLAPGWWAPLPTLAALALPRVVGAPDAYRLSIGFTVDALLVAALLLQLMQLAAAPAWSWLESRPVRYVGRISYPMYLYHAFAVSAALRVPVAALQFPAAVAAAILFGTASYYLIERPALRLRPR